MTTDDQDPRVPSTEEARAAGMVLNEQKRTLTARGVVHQLRVIPNDDYSGWIVSVQAPSGAALLPQAQARVLARLLLAGPGQDPRERCEHGTPQGDLCLDCLSETDTELPHI